MDTPVKERLIGAVILVLLLAILVPEMLSGPKPSKPATAAGGLSAPLRTYTIDLSGDSASPAKPAMAPEPASTPSPGPTPQPVPIASAVPDPVAQAPVSAPPTPAAEAKPRETVASARPAGSWVVQLGSFSKAQNAQKLVKELKGKQYKAFVSRTGTGAKTRYRVRVGPEEDRGRAQALAERLKREGQQVSIIPTS